jgi:carbamoyltransferase
MRVGPRHPRLAAAGFHAARFFLEPYFRRRHIHRADSAFAHAKYAAIRAKIERGETVYLAGVSAAGAHNSGIALIEVTRANGPRLLFNNEEERFSGEKHTNAYPRLAIDALAVSMADMALTPANIDGWFAAWDITALCATLLRTVLEEAPASLAMAFKKAPLFDPRELDRGFRASRQISEQLGLREPIDLIGTAHHDNHAWFSFATSPFARHDKPVMIAVLDGLGDMGSVSLYVVERRQMRMVYANNSVFDSLGIFYSVISSTQGGWTWLSSEGRYMGATAYGNTDRKTNPYYQPLRAIFDFAPNGEIFLNRDLANWQRDILDRPYSAELIRILGEPIPPDKMWNPDAVLRVEDIAHAENTKDRLDKAAATQMVYEDALEHIVGHFIRATGSDRLVLSGGLGLNALGNMRLMERFEHLHLWVPPVPNDSGVTAGAAFMGAYLCGHGVGAPVEHAFYCGSAPSARDIRAALAANADTKWIELAPGKDIAALADFMAYMTSKDAIIALYQGPAEIGPRALGHRSILANPCNPQTRENLNAKVKYRESIRPLAPMLTLEAAQKFFDLADGASDAGYNAYNYMVLTAHAKPEARAKIPSVVHADGTGRLQIVRENTDPLTYAYLKALGRRIGVEVAVNTSFNVAGPIAQTPQHALDTLKRSKGLDAVLMVAKEGAVFAALHASGGERFKNWLAEWQRETGKRLT